jgi:hypothetical protein
MFSISAVSGCRISGLEWQEYKTANGWCDLHRLFVNFFAGLLLEKTWEESFIREVSSNPILPPSCEAGGYHPREYKSG